MADLKPSLEDITITYEFFATPLIRDVHPAALGAVMHLLWMSAAARVWTYTEPDPTGAINFSDENRMHLICAMTPDEWKVHRKDILRFFKQRKDKLYPIGDWIQVKNSGNKRPAIPAAVRAEVMQRDGYRCSYCGTEQGPFALDHIVPRSKGGSDTSDNLQCACVPCNRDKRDKDLAEWLDSTEEKN